MSDLLETVRVELGERSYEIAIGAGNLGEIGRLVALSGDVGHAVVITDENVEKPHGLAAAESVAHTSAAVDLVVVEQRLRVRVERHAEIARQAFPLRAVAPAHRDQTHPRHALREVARVPLPMDPEPDQSDLQHARILLAGRGRCRTGPRSAAVAPPRTPDRPWRT